MRLIKLNGVKWLVGLQWYVPSMQASLDDIKQYVENAQCDCIVKRGIQIGYGSSDGNDALIGKPSLAAKISITVNSIVGIFSLVDDLTEEPFWWLFARINGNNMAGFGDTIFDSLEDAEKAKDELMDLLSNTEIEEEVKCVNERESLRWLSSRCDVNLFSRFSGQYAVKRLSSFHGHKHEIAKKAVLGIVTVAFLGACVNYGYDYLTSLGITSKAQKHSQEIKRKRQEIENNPELLFSPVWQNYPKASASAGSCLSAISKHPLNYGGWNLSNAQCAMGDKSGNLILLYLHTPLASYRYIPDDATSMRKGKSDGGTEIREFNLRRPLAWNMNIPGGPDYRELPARNQIRRIFLEMAQTFGIKAGLSFAAPETKKVPEVGNFTCPWVRGTFVFQNVESTQINGLCEFLGKIPALFITRIEFDLDKWKISGEVYAL